MALAGEVTEVLRSLLFGARLIQHPTLKQDHRIRGEEVLSWEEGRSEGLRLPSGEEECKGRDGDVVRMRLIDTGRTDLDIGQSETVEQL